jgi:hypothetical protein
MNMYVMKGNPWKSHQNQTFNAITLITELRFFRSINLVDIKIEKIFHMDFNKT